MSNTTTIQLRRGTAAQATADNPTLAAGEVGFETDTGKLKIGDGSTPWTALPYATDLSRLPSSVVTGSPAFDSASNIIIDAGADPPIRGAAENVGLGHQALASLTSGVQNCAIGSYSQQLSTTTVENISMGYRTLGSNTTGSHNLAFGDESMRYADGASNCVALGKITLKVNQGNQNTAVGDSALAGNTIGAYNTAVGASAMEASTTGSNNVAFGYEAGLSLVTGASNTFLGAFAGHTDGTTASSSSLYGVTLLGFAAQATTNDVIVLGQAIPTRPNMIFGGVGASAAFGGGVGVFAIAPAVTNPSSTPIGAGLLYVDAATHALTYCGPSGTKTVLASA